MTDIPPPPTANPARTRTPLRIFLPFVGIAAVFLLYTVYWFIAADKLREGIENFSTRDNPSDINVDWSALSVGGFPYRISATFTGPLANAPNAPENWAWSAPSLEADFMPYNLRHVVLKVDGEQQLSYSDVRGRNPLRHLIRTQAAGTWVSYVHEPDEPLGRIAIDIDKFTGMRDGIADDDLVTGISGERLSADRLQLHLRPASDDGSTRNADDTSTSYDIALQGDNMHVNTTGPVSVLGHDIALISVQARLRDVPRRSTASLVKLSRDWLQQGGRLTVSDLTIKWGPLDLWAQGNVTLDEEARPKGNFDAEITNYAGLLEALVEADIVRRQDAKLALMGLGLVSQLQGKTDGRIAVPVTMNQGKLYLGPLFVARLDPVY